jgi:AraC family transcriptional regulator, positive regulator of tynA and feaB
MLWQTCEEQAWNALISQEFGPRTCLPKNRGAFQAEIAIIRGVDGLVLANARSPAACIRQDRQQSQEAELVMHIQLSGQSATKQAGKVATLGAGDFVVIDANKPYEVDFDDLTEITVLRMPQALLRNRIPMLQDVVLDPFSTSRAGVELFSSFLRNFWVLSRCRSLESLGSGLTDSLQALVSMAIGTDRPPQNTLRNATVERWNKIQRYVEDNLHRPELDALHIADHVGCSVRTVQLAFAARGETTSSFLLNRRLDLAAQRLRGGSRLAIMPVCLDSGFSDLSYFTRSFRHRFGISPARYRDTLPA